MKKLFLVIIVLTVSAIIVSASYLLPRSTPVETESSSSISGSQHTQIYSDENYRFSFKYPEGYTVTTVPGVEDGKTILVESLDKKVGIQIIISLGSDVDITEAMIKSDIPNMKVSDAQPVEIGLNRKGLAFMSDNPAFNGASREVWFMFGGNLYQISTYAEFDEQLKKIFSSWTFF